MLVSLAARSARFGDRESARAAERAASEGCGRFRGGYGERDSSSTPGAELDDAMMGPDEPLLQIADRAVRRGRRGVLRSSPRSGCERATCLKPASGRPVNCFRRPRIVEPGATCCLMKAVSVVALKRGIMASARGQMWATLLDGDQHQRGVAALQLAAPAQPGRGRRST